ncbi:MAG: hypothetical protein QM658_11250 [Gordonia sp. (in: high G+C Gram-positive bacteria)]
MEVSADELSTRLMDAAVEFTVAQVTDTEQFRELVQDEIEHFLAESGALALEDAMPRQLIKSVAHKYAVQFPVEGAIPELVGKVASRLYRHEINESVVLSDLLDARRFDELATAVVEMPMAQRAVSRILDSETTVDTVSDVVQRAVVDRFGRIGARFSGLVDKVTRAGAEFVLESAREDPDTLLLDAAREFWHGQSDGDPDAFRETVTDVDLEDATVLVFEIWRTFRETEYFRTLLDAGIDEVFDVYGATELRDVIEDLGISHDDLIEEAMRFGPTVIQRIDREGFLESVVRRRLAPFFASPQYAKAVGG